MKRTNLNNLYCLAILFCLATPPSGLAGVLPEAVTVFEQGRDGWPDYRIPSLITTTKGSCLAVLADQSIGCLFEQDGCKKIGFARVTLDWLTDGKGKRPELE
ncbi:MAG: sialidase family protein [Verrucomicrobiota bacterium]